jgi:signal transduction histidine kinase/AmiR/NasT family two-component response regulator
MGRTVKLPAQQFAAQPGADTLASRQPERELGELGRRLEAAPDAEAALSAALDALGAALGACGHRVRAESTAGFGEDVRALLESARSSGQVCSGSVAGEAVLIVPVRLPTFELALFWRAEPFTELDRGVAGIGAALLETSFAKRRAESELVSLRAQLEQNERLKCVGQLATGLAHDFNNLLMVISAAAEVVSDRVEVDHPAAHQLGLIVDTSYRAAELTRKLLAFSRQRRPATKPVDIHEVVATVREFLAHGIDPCITLQLSPCAGPCVVQADATQLGNAILNVCLNARDAMPQGGLLRITTQRVELDSAECAGRHLGCEPGAYVRLDVTDTGTGMDERTLERAFEPFFTTKEPERGTGLGLPSVLATLREHRGSVAIESQPGGGTTCSLFLPLSEPAQLDAPASAPGSRRTTALRVLLVDDEPGVCLTAAQLMRQLGHNVQALCSGEKALSHLRVHSSGYDLLVLDVMMPHPTGLEVYRTLLREGIELPTVFVSGSTTNPLLSAIVESEGVGFLQKPFRQAELAQALHSCIERWRARNADLEPLRAG